MIQVRADTDKNLTKRSTTFHTLNVFHALNDDITQRAFPETPILAFSTDNVGPWRKRSRGKSIT